MMAARDRSGLARTALSSKGVALSWTRRYQRIPEAFRRRVESLPG